MSTCPECGGELCPGCERHVESCERHVESCGMTDEATGHVHCFECDTCLEDDPCEVLP